MIFPVLEGTVWKKASAERSGGYFCSCRSGSRCIPWDWSLDEKEIYQIPVGGLLTGDYLCGKLKTLADSTVLCAMDIKSVLKHVSLDDPKKVFDAGVAAYLLNPLKSSYSHDDIAREYLDGMMLPSKEDLLGKTSLKKAWEEELECLGNYACYQAFVPCMARKVLLEKLDETGMRKVYDEIELPLVFTLDSMEKWGISVKGEELKSYGEKLKVRIQELEKTIWQEAGEEFNINSPKQLGVILFEKLQIASCQENKKQDIRLRRMYWKSWLRNFQSWIRFWNTVSLQS